MLETKVMTAPNSPSAAEKAVMAPARIPGNIRGRVMVAKRSTPPAPRVRAASSRPRSTPSREIRMALTISGKDMTAVASAAPLRVNTSSMPKVRSSHPPMSPRVPNTINRR
jgi:hypothetical protein